MQSQTQLLDFYRSNLKAMNDVVKASLESTERLHNQQLQQVRSALDETVKSTAQLAQVNSIEELLAVQARLAGAQLQRTMDFWGSLWRVASDSQINMISQVQSLTSRAAEETVRIATSQVSGATGAAREASTALLDAASQHERQQQERQQHRQQQHRKAG